MMKAYEVNYEKMYLTIFNRVTDAIQYMDQKEYTLARAVLIAAQQETEELYLNAKP